MTAFLETLAVLSPLIAGALLMAAARFWPQRRAGKSVFQSVLEDGKP